MDTLVPVNMRDAVKAALDALTERVGDLDLWVATELNYSVADLHRYFGAEQIDAIALAIQAIENGAGFIIGDQTGIGKGRVNAAMIRYAIEKGLTPIFVTEKPNLYKDLYRDLADIGMPEINPFMTNADQDIDLTDDGSKKIRADAGNKQRIAREMMGSGSLGKFDVIFTTYSQLQTVDGKLTWRHDFMRTFADGGMVILDESHNAGGTEQKGRGGKKPAEGAAEGRAGFVRGLVRMAKGVFYSSATFAKRPSVMSLYSATDMKLAVAGAVDKLAAAIEKGGVPLQQVVSAMLAKAGQYIRRERSFAGIEYATTEAKVDRAVPEKAAEVMRAITVFDKLKKQAVQTLKQEVKKEAKSVTMDGSIGEAGVTSTNFTSIMHNMISQMLLALKAKPAAEMAIAALRRGEKPVLTVSNTMGSFIAQYVEDNGLKPGDAIDISFRDLMMRYLERSREVIVKDAYGNKRRHRLTDEQLGHDARTQWEAIKRNILAARELDSIPLSPLDYLKAEVVKAGFTYGEITGRSETIDYTGSRPIYRVRAAAETTVKAKNRLIADYNSGKVDVILLNQSGSTGLSLHASERVADQRRRHMIIVQPEANIDTHMQMLGRINRTGQVTNGVVFGNDATFAKLQNVMESNGILWEDIEDVTGRKLDQDKPIDRALALQYLRTQGYKEPAEGKAPAGKPAVFGLPRYTQLVADVPAEKRPAAVLAKKMASLNANTTAARGSALTSKETVDFMNDYGDQVVARIMEDNPDIHALLGDPLPFGENGGLSSENAIARVTGRIPMLTLKQQEELYDLIESEYRSYYEEKERLGENALEAKTLELDAKVVDRKQVFDGHGGGSPFSEGAFAETLDVKKLGRPFTPDEVIERVASAVSLPPETKIETLRRTAAAEQARVLDKLEADFRDYKRSVLDDIEDHRKREAMEAKLDAQMERMRSLLTQFNPGRSIEFKPANSLVSDEGVVLEVTHKPGAKNPAAPSSWRWTIAIANATRVVSIPASRLYTESLAPAGAVPSGSYLLKPAAVGHDWRKAFENAQSSVREQRIMITGNLLAGYSQFQRGQIVNYTTADGEIRQGIFMPASFDLETALESLPVTFPDAATALTFLRQMDGKVPVNAADPDLLRVVTIAGGDLYTFVTKRAREVGGKVYLNQEVLDILRKAGYGEFVSSGTTMRVNDVDRRTAEAVLQVLMDEGIEVQAAGAKDEARQIIAAGRPAPLNDIERGQRVDAAYAAYQASEAKRVSAVLELRKLARLLEQGKLTEQEYVDQAHALWFKLEDKSDGARRKGARTPLVRGPEWVEERLLRGARLGELDQAAVDLALWVLRGNRHLADGLAISVAKGGGHVVGSYEMISRVMTLMKSNTHTDTIVHEILHHTERMMPQEVQSAIAREWLQQVRQAIIEAIQAGDTMRAFLLAKAPEATAGSVTAQAELKQAFKDGTLGYDDYQLLNPSEFWAVNASRILSARHRARHGGPGVQGWVAIARQWLREFLERIKGALGLKSDAPVLKALDAILKTDGARGTGSRSIVEAAAHQAATSPLNNLDEPTPAQKEAGNYKKGHVTINGLDITIENPEGSRRRPEWPVLKSHYGYVKGTEGNDGDHVDLFIKPGTPPDYDGPVFVVDQVNKGGEFDEHKVMLGWPDEDSARRGYLANYTAGWDGLGGITRMSMSEFKAWLEHGDTTERASEAFALDNIAAQQGRVALTPAERLANDITLTDRVLRAPFKLADAMGIRRLFDSGRGLLEKTGAWVANTEIGGKIAAGVISHYGLNPDYLDRATETWVNLQKFARATGSFVERLAMLDRGQSRIAYLWMQEKPDSREEEALMAALPRESRQTLIELKEMIAQLGAEAVRLGQLSADVYERNKLAYLHRSYLRHEAEKTVAANMGSAVNKKLWADQYKGRGIKDWVDMERVARNIPDWWDLKTQKAKADLQLRGRKFYRFERRDPVGEGVEALPGFENTPRRGKLREVVYWPADVPPPKKFDAWTLDGTWEARYMKGGKVGFWRDFTAAERAKMGEMDEVKFAIAKTLHLMAHDIEVGKMLEWVGGHYSLAKLEPGMKEVTPSESLGAAYGKNVWVRVPDTKVPGTNVARYGAIAGRYVPGPIWNDIRQNAAMGRDDNDVMRAYQAVLNVWKVNKTALSPTVHANNVMANFFIADFHDLRARDLVHALEVALLKGRDEKFKRLYERFEDSGALYGMFRYHEIQSETIDPLLAELRKESMGALQGEDENAAMTKALTIVSLLNKIGDAARYGRDKLVNAYSAEDEIFRLAMFLKGTRNGLPDAEAGKLARKAFLDYNINAPWIQALRKSVFPFIAFPYRALPMMISTFYNKPWKLVKYVALGSILNALAYAALGAGADEDRERALLPDEKAGKVWGLFPKLVRMPWNRNNAPVFLDVRRWFPMGDVWETQQNHAAVPMLPVMMPGGPLDLMFEVWKNQSGFTGQKITEDRDTAGERVQKTALYAWRAFMPNNPLVPWSYSQSGLIGAAGGGSGPLGSYGLSGQGTDVFGRELSLPQAFWATMGVKLGTYPPEVLERNTKAQALGEIANVMRGVKKDQMDFRRGSISKAKLDEEQAEAREKIRAIQQRVDEKMRRARGEARP